MATIVITNIEFIGKMEAYQFIWQTTSNLVNLEYFDGELEALFPEIDKRHLGTDKNTIIGVIDRPRNFRWKLQS